LAETMLGMPEVCVFPICSAAYSVKAPMNLYGQLQCDAMYA